MTLFFKKRPNINAINQFYGAIKETHPSWMAMNLNTNPVNSDKDLFEHYALEVVSKKTNATSGLKFGVGNNHNYLETYIEGKVNQSGLIDAQLREDSTQCFEKTLHLFLNEVREKLVAIAKTPSRQDFKTSEDKGVEWLRVSFDLLTKALETTAKGRLSDGGEVVQGLLFCGQHPATKKNTFRLRIFNLDIEAIEDEVESLRVTVKNKKDKEHFDGVEDSLRAVFCDEKHIVIDYFIKLLNPIGLAILSRPS